MDGATKAYLNKSQHSIHTSINHPAPVHNVIVPAPYLPPRLMDPSQELDLAKLTELDLYSPIPQDVLDKILAGPPFISLPGGFNVRDLGVSGGASYIRPGRVYRSGMLGALTEEGKRKLPSELGVQVILDLRSAAERTSIPSPDIPGVQIAWIPSERRQRSLDLKDFVGENGGEKAYTNMYMEILELYAPSYRYALEYLRDAADSDGGILFHCSAGKDRTGVLAAILLGLAGAPDSEIAADYALTRIGMEPQRELLTQIFLKGKPDWHPGTPGFIPFASVKASYMLEFLSVVREKYGSLEGYVKSHLGMSEADVEKVKIALRG